MKIISVATMRALDKATIEGGTPEETLMKRAGSGAFHEIQLFLKHRLAHRHGSRVAIVAGKGNNAGDAYVVAGCFAKETKLPTTVYATCPRSELKGACRQYADAIAGHVPIIVCKELPSEVFEPGTVIIDGLLGTGISGPLRPPYDRFIAQINASHLPVMALDIPSGLDGDSGSIATDAIMADLTATMAQPKAGMLTETGQRHCGAIRCIDIGIPSELVNQANSLGEALFLEDVSSLLPRRDHASHKGSFGHVLVAGGSRLYPGAPFLAGAAALRVGAGLSTVAIPAAASAQTAVAPLKALIVRPLPDDGGGFFCKAGEKSMAELLNLAGTVVFGPGIGQCPVTENSLRQILASPLPAIIDADGLRLLAQHPTLTERAAPTVLTPHPGEMRVLLAGFGLSDYIDAPRIEQARVLARKANLFVVLKGMGTVIARTDGEYAINTSGNSGLATAGSGDVLAGMLAGLLAQKFTPWDALRVGVFLHGYAAEIAPQGMRALVADDLLSLIGPAFREMTPFA